MRRGKLALVGVAAATVLVLVGCGGGGGGSAPTQTAGSSAPPTSPSEAESSEPGVITITAPVSAATTGYSETQFTVAADQPFTIHFDNQDAGIPHNVAIYAGDTVSGTPVWEPGTNVFLTGPDTDDYDIPALAAGTYTFACQSHPTSMTGTLTVQ